MRELKATLNSNRPNIRQKNDIYYSDEKIKCECGSEIFYQNKKTHEKSIKHKDFIKDKKMFFELNSIVSNIIN